MDIPLGNILNLFERIAENQFIWPSERKTPRKIAGIHKLDTVRAMTAQLEVLTKTLDKLI